MSLITVDKEFEDAVQTIRKYPGIEICIQKDGTWTPINIARNRNEVRVVVYKE